MWLPGRLGQTVSQECTAWPNRGFLLECGIKVMVGPDFSCFELCKNQIRLPHSWLHAGIANVSELLGDFLHIFHRVIQATQASPCGSGLSMLQFCSKEQDNPWHLEPSLGFSEERRKACKDGAVRGGLASSGSTAVVSQPARSHHRAPRAQPLGRQGLAQDAVTGRAGPAELPHEVLFRGQQHRVPGRDVQLSSRAPVFPGEDVSRKVCVQRVEVRPVKEELQRMTGKHTGPWVNQ